ncbi:hypothetical protein BO83DRAFT_327543 [Aspergillus eucalypticola CBS 122712]|uniref:Zn(2)-C6 fungal-type domain-containing protein n=1 Tax=Aspergillus eucalypticola (strain CBS 122712 / IBT 29274) TaxID=1448314 RepID=A0A317UK23_ASPEC|nr:uncharacterized protein BO83DRAFT_327543 [Aspergillus eucalypticola CBS 122712]PWY61659.1 hypothetical protein BO83DRAFT_327543 [Aspergillus eucalypticola CBS 122712]
MKVPIPRIARPHRSAYSSRVSKACVTCREKKIKCNGSHPCCGCISNATTCLYTAGKRENTSRRLAELESQIRLYKQLLWHLQSKVNACDRELISRTLDQVTTSCSNMIYTWLTL